MTPDAAPARQLPPVGHRARLADDPWRIGEGRVRAAGAAADAELFTSVYDPAPLARALRDRAVHASFLDRLPGARRHYPKLLPLMNLAFESFDLSEFDLVVSSQPLLREERADAAPSTLHVCYCHTPMRHAWEPRHLAGELGAGAAARGPHAARPAAPQRPGRAPSGPTSSWPTRPTSRRASASTTGATRVVVHPPVDVERHLAPPAPGPRRLLPRASAAWCPTRRSTWPSAPAPRWAGRVKVVGDGRGLEAARAGGRARTPSSSATSPTPSVAELLSRRARRCCSRARRTSGSCRSRPRPPESR